MVSVRSVLQEVPDPRGKKGQLHRLEAILGLILLSMLSGRKGMKAAFHLGRSLSRKQLDRLGVRRDRKSPCHATLTETLRVLDPDAMAAVFARVTVAPSRNEGSNVDPRQIALDGKTLRGSKDAQGKAEHVFRPSVRLLNNPLAIHPHAGRGGKSPMRCDCSRRLTLRG